MFKLKNSFTLLGHYGLRKLSLLSSFTLLLSMAAFCGAVATAQTNASWRRELPFTSPPARHDYAMSTCQGGNVLMFGGTTKGNAYLNDTWLWNGSNWTNLTAQTAPANRPPVRGSATMAFDPIHNQVVLFGGQSYYPQQARGDTWLFNGTSWKQVFPSTSPPARFGASMTFDENSQRVILFGGNYRNGGYAWNDTWAWNGSSWTQLDDPRGSNRPFSRESAAMAYFPPGSGGGYILLLGGYVDGFTLDNTDILFTNIERFLFPVWAPGDPFSSSLADSAMAYYPISNKILLFGGRDSNQLGTNLTATWFPWTTLSSLNPLPAPRSGARLAYHQNTGRLVLFGGLSDNNFDLGDTWTWGKQVACLPGDDSALHVGTTVRCFFQEETDVHFGYWSAEGFSPNSTTTVNKTFHTNGPGPASITAVWFDGAGEHTKTFHFTIEQPHE